MSKHTHTCGYEVGIDEEILVGEDLYYATIDLGVDFNSEGEAIQVEVAKCKIEGPLEGQVQAWTTEGRQLERVIVHGEPALTEAIDNALWRAIDQYSEDNAYDICREVETDYDERLACWGSDL
jgi:hypothetical protein